MFNVCPHCGLYTDEKAIDPDGPFAICPHCGYRHRFVRLPLFIVTGASGAGKTATCVRLAPQMAECVCLEADIFWRQEFNTPENDYRAFRNLCLRLAKNIGQSGRPVALFGSAVPAQYETARSGGIFRRRTIWRWSATMMFSWSGCGAAPPGVEPAATNSSRAR